MIYYHCILTKEEDGKLELQEIIDLIPTIITAITLTFITIIYAIAKIKAVIAAAKNGDTEALNQLASELIITAEGFDNWTGAQKKDYVLNKLEVACLKNKVEVESEVLSEVIENIIDLTNKVNTGGN